MRILQSIITFCIVAVFSHFLLLGITRKSNYKEVGVWNEIVKGNIDADLIFVGSSRTSQHFDTPQIKNNQGINSYNLGLDGTLFDIHLERLKIYLRYNKKPQHIVIGVDLESFEKKTGIWNESSFIHMLNQEGLYNILNDYDNNFFYRKYVPLYGFAEMNKLYLGGIIRSINSKKSSYNRGFIPVDRDWENMTNQKMELMFQIDPYYVEKLKELIQLSKSSSKKVTLVYSPAFDTKTIKIKNTDYILSLYRKISEELNIQFLDYSHHYLSYDNSIFYNSQHMNSKGASLFTEVLMDSLSK